jgi:hypothetical protein
MAKIKVETLDRCVNTDRHTKVLCDMRQKSET